jgi:Fe-S-cluster containining protein
MSDPKLVSPLRKDLTWEGDETRRVLVDPRLGRRVKVDARGYLVATLMDRPQPIAELAARIAATGQPMTDAALAKVVEVFEGLGLLDTADIEFVVNARNEVVAKFRDGRPDMPLIIPEDLRFTCTCCGSCCHGVNIGPVTEDVQAGLSGERYAALAAEEPRKPDLLCAMVPDGDPEGKVITVCQSVNGRCVFEREDGLCRIHARYGMEFKPHVCRLFPFHFHLTPRGVVVGLQMECRDILRAAQGQPVREQQEEVRGLLALLDDIPEVRQFLSVDGEATMSYEAYEALEAEVLDLVTGRGSGGFDTILEVNRRVLDRCARSRDGGERLPLKVDVYGFLQEFAEALLALKTGQRLEGDAIRFHSANMDLVIEALTDVPLFADAILKDDGSEEGRRLSSMALASYWQAKDVLTPPDLVTGVAVFGLKWFLVRALAMSRARQVHRMFPCTQDLVDAWVVVSMLTRNKRVLKVMQRFYPAIGRLFADRLPEILEKRVELTQVRPGLDFYLF